MSVQKIPLAGSTFNTEISTALVPVTGSGTPTPTANGILTYTTTGAHGLVAGQAVTFTGVTPTLYNNSTFVVISVPSTTTFTIQTNGTAQLSVIGSVIPVFFPKAGFYYTTTGANALWQYNPDNTGYVDPGQILSTTNVATPPTAAISAPTPQSALSATWRTAVPVSSQGLIWTDGYGVRLICSGSAGTTTYVEVK